MDKKLFVIAIAVGTVVLTTLFQLFLQGRDLNPKAKRLLWIIFAAGVVALIAVSMIVLFSTNILQQFKMEAVLTN
jgi:hypothetical protein